MGDIAVENYIKSVKAAMARWSVKMDKIQDDLATKNAELKKLEANKTPSTTEQKKIDQLKIERKKLGDKVDTVWLELRTDLMLLLPPALTKDNERELLKLPPIVAELVKKKGLEIGKSGVVLTPDIDFDFKAGKLKKLGLTLKYEW
jgi:hypothetical protein